MGQEQTAPVAPNADWKAEQVVNAHRVLIQRAKALEATSPEETLDRVRLELVGEVSRLSDAHTHELINRGVPSAAELHRRFEEEGNGDHGRSGGQVSSLDRIQARTSAETYTGLVTATPRFRSSNPQLAGLENLHLQLREATVEAARLTILMTISPPPPTTEFVRTIRDGQYIRGRWDPAVELFHSPVGYFWVNRLEEPGCWTAHLVPANRQGRDLAPNRAVTPCLRADVQVTREAICAAIDALTTRAVAEQLAGHMPLDKG